MGKKFVLTAAGVAALVVPTAVVTINLPSARAQSAQSRTAGFEAASIRPSSAQGFMTVRPLPGRLTADASLNLLIRNAYSVQPFQILGGPDWTGSERYQIEATADRNAGPAEIFLMLQSLLEDRFQLKIHHETRELPVYALVAAKSGLKLPPPKEGGCVSPAADAPAEWTGGRMTPPADGQLPLARCGSVSVALSPAGARMQGGKIPMPEFTRALSMVFGRTVVDKTGFTGLFDVRLDFLPDETTSALPPPPPDAAGASPASRSPSIFTALQEQLGLRIESAKGPVDVLVIDHAEKPSAN